MFNKQKQTAMKTMTIEMNSFDVNRLPKNSHGVIFPKTSAYLTNTQFIPPIGTRIGVVNEKLIDLNPNIENHETPEDYVTVKGITLRPWLNEIQVVVIF